MDGLKRLPSLLRLSPREAAVRNPLVTQLFSFMGSDYIPGTVPDALMGKGGKADCNVKRFSKKTSGSEEKY